VLEPRSNTMKLGQVKGQLAASLQQADASYGYAPCEGPHALGWDLGATLAPLGSRAQVFEQLDALVAAVSRDARPGDHVLVMSNGGFGGVHGRLLEALGAKARAAPASPGSSQLGSDPAAASGVDPAADIRRGR